MYNILLTALIVVAVILIILVIMQPSKSNAASMLTGADDGQSKTKARGFEAFLIRATSVFGVLFFVLAIALAMI
ncbi:preprotein translocase subunit SecG [Hutsoniella sourekii]